MEQKNPGYEFTDEIDVRLIVKALLRHKWWIVIAAFVAAVMAFVLFKFVIPDQYKASAMVILTKPVFTTALDPRIQASPELPDAKSLIDLTEADDLIFEVFESPELVDLLEEEATPASLKEQIQASLIGTNQLRLEVTDTDPQRGAKIVNIWADKVVLRLNKLFDVNATSLEQIQQQKDSARENWEASEQALLDYLPQNKVEVIQVNLAQAQDTLRTYLDKLESLDLLISDVQVLESRLLAEQRGSPLLLQDALSLIALQQRGAGSLQGLQVQISGPDILGEGYTIGEAIGSVNNLSASLQAQREEVVNKLDGLEETITQLATDLEMAKYQVDKLTAQRDLALSTYQALSSQEEEIQIALSQDDRLAKIAGLALPPEIPSGPRSLIVAGVAGFTAFVIACSVVLILAWWVSPGHKEIQESGKS